MTEEERLKLIGAFKRFKKSQIWKMIVDNFQTDIEECISTIETIGADSDKIYTARDLAVLQKNDIIKLINYPDEQIKALEGTQKSPMDDLENTLDDDFIDDLEEDL
jgi:hypothetical protein